MNAKHTQKTIKKKIIRNSVKIRFFYAIAFFIPILFFALFEITLRIFSYGGNTELFIPTPYEESKYYGINLNIGKRYFYNSQTTPTPRKDLFLRDKPKNSFRIFVLGGSTAAGYPYGNNMMFSRVLYYRLADTFPDLHIEIVNTALTAVNSYTLLDFMDEIIEQKPDALLIYAGHNEFYGALGAASAESLGKIRWGVNIFLKLQRFKTFRLLRSVMTQVISWINSEVDAKSKYDSDTLMKRIVKDQKIALDSPLYELGKGQFERNLADIFQIAKENNIPVMISELVSNIRDNRPFTSIKSANHPAADNVYRAAQKLEKQRKFDEARNKYYQAKDLDALRFRATEEFNQIIIEKAAEFKIPVVPMKSYFEKNSTNGLIGDNLLLEHLHPNSTGYFLMGEAFYNSMRKAGFVKKKWNAQNIKSSEYYRKNWGFTKLDSAYAAMNVLHLKGGWPFKPAYLPNTILSQFNPLTKEDSIVLHIVKTGKSTLETGHMTLADYHVSKKNYEQAFNEYKALIYTVPYEYFFYERAIQLLLTIGAYDRALPILEQAAKIKESAFVLKWSGQIYLKKNQVRQSIVLLEKALKQTPKDTQIMWNLYKAYIRTSQTAKADKVLQQYKRVDPNSPEIGRLQAYKKSYLNKSAKEAD